MRPTKLLDVDNPWEAIVWLVRYATKEILAIIVILLIGYILVANVSYDKQNGFQWRPSVHVEIGK